ncbi:substrate-binding periplasmic protein [Pseudodesulfovibrio methanolicus]|uniref:ABC transporter substrate-binding protein n=1 Tax=Pseudodesulfovibrio methanolicus TaxID=3126690 RepID=A0ABZ2IZ34_9BACT
MNWLSRFSPAVFLLFFLWPLTNSARAAASADLRVLAEPNGRAVQPQNGGLGGWAVDLVRELMDRTHCTAAIEPMPWARAYDIALNKPGVVLFPTTRTEERDPRFYWVGPIFRVRWCFLARKGSGVTIRCLDDARRVGSIGTYFGDARDRYLAGLGFTNLQRAASDATNYRKLEYGRLDLIVGSDTGLESMADAAGIDPNNFEPVFVLKEVDLYVALSHGTAPETVDAWQRAFRTMRDDGTLAGILNRWYPGLKPPLDERLPWRDKND